MDPLLASRDPRLVRADLADDPGTDPGVADAIGPLANDLVGEVVDGAPVDEQLGRVVRLPVPAAAHDDVQARRTGEATKPLRIAADAVERELHEGRPSSPAEVTQLLGEEVLVGGELPVVPPILDVPQVDARVLVRERESELLRRDRAGDGHDARRHRRTSSSVCAGRGRWAGRRRSVLIPTRACCHPRPHPVVAPRYPSSI